MPTKISNIHTSGESKVAFDMDKFVFPKIPTLFKRDETTKLVIPELHDDCGWVRRGEGLVTIKMDGIQVKIKPDIKGQLKPYRRLKGYVSQNAYVAISEHDLLDKPLWEAYQNLVSKEAGFYEAYGRDIQGNHHNLERNLMVKIIPVGGALMVAVNAPGLRLKRYPAVTVETFFKSVEDELWESPEIEGLVFQFESPSMNPVKFAKIERKDFGFEWPPQKPPKGNVEIVTVN